MNKLEYIAKRNKEALDLVQQAQEILKEAQDAVKHRRSREALRLAAQHAEMMNKIREIDDELDDAFPF